MAVITCGVQNSLHIRKNRGFKLQLISIRVEVRYRGLAYSSKIEDEVVTCSGPSERLVGSGGNDRRAVSGYRRRINDEDTCIGAVLRERKRGLRIVALQSNCCGGAIPNRVGRIRNRQYGARRGTRRGHHCG